MPLLKNNEFVSDDWAFLPDDAALPESGKVVVSLTRLVKDWDQLVEFTGLLGLSLANSERTDELEAYLPQLTLVVLTFPAFTDGRAYSQARELRLQGYRGELRAQGNLLPDQFQYLNQVGFDSFVVDERFSLVDWQGASKQMSLAYQRGLYRTAGEREVWSQRHQGFAAWEEQPHAG
ncbi:MAG: DUF934 domain-containing protein [Alphaproteobacteria bacterium]|nr:DUF934 domain-containing protein [Alphaproteobacteria bacterium]